MRILVTGFAFVRENIVAVFDHYPADDQISFLLPAAWPIKGGKFVYHPPEGKNIHPAPAYFSHSHYPFIGGAFKGIIPSLPLFLWRHRAKRFDVLFSAMEPLLLSTLYEGFWAKMFGMRHVIFTWENIPYKNKFSGANLWYKELIIRLNLGFADAIICGNRKATAIMDSYTKKPHPIIPLSGVDGEFFKKLDIPKRFREYDLSDNIVYSFIGSISHRKGVHLIVRAFKDILASIPHARLVIAGIGEDDFEKEIEQLIDDLGVRATIIRFSWVSHEEVRALMSISDVFVYPSMPYKGWEDQLGYSTMEASLTELPVITTQSGSMDEVVKDGETGLLIKPDNLDELREAMLRLGQDGELRTRLGKAARQFMLDNFSHQAVAKKMADFFHTLR